MNRPILHPEIEAYLHELLTPRPDVVREMEREAERRHFPIVGPLVGELLAVLARAVVAERVFELGSGFGYSTYWLAQAVGRRGVVVHTDLAKAGSEQARGYLGRLGLADRVRFVVGDGLEALAQEPGMFDLVFCDIDKHDYPRVPAVALPRLRRGGLLVFDNTLWHGRVADRAGLDTPTAAIRELNRELRARADVRTSLLPLRDGVSVSVKI